MARSIFSGEDPVKNAIRTAERAEARATARAEDAARYRAGAAAGRGSRSIGVTRKQPGR